MKNGESGLDQHKAFGLGDQTYPELIQEMFDISFESFEKSGNVQHLADILGSVGSLKRLKPELRNRMQGAISEAETRVGQLSVSSLKDFGEAVDLSSLESRLKRLAKIKPGDLRDEGIRTSALLTVDDLLDRRDTVYLAFKELQARGVPVPKDKTAWLEHFDQEAVQNPTIRWGLSASRPISKEFEPNELKGLWWWEVPEKA